MEQTKQKGLFIVFEGIDGSGSTTQADEIGNILNSRGVSTHITREPTDSLIGGLIRSLLRGHWSLTPEGLQLLFAADRAHHLKTEVIPILEKGVNVMSDRYYFSSIAYGSVDISDDKFISDINRLFPEPDLVIYLRVSASEAMRRIQAGRHTETELFEKEQQLSMVVAAYDNLAKERDYFVSIDGMMPREKVTEAIIKVLQDRFNLG